MSDQIMIQVRFRKSYKDIEFNDALYFTQAEYALKTEDEIDAMKEERFQAWCNIIDNPPIPSEETPPEENP